MKIDLSEEALDKLDARYQCPYDETKIEYQRFLDDINTVFTVPNLDKDP